MTKLSPAAQAVLDAAYREMDYAPRRHVQWITAAALRAAADHCHSQEIREADHTTRRWICVDDLLAIAAEFEAQ
jgi:hypothetical protein